MLEYGRQSLSCFYSNIPISSEYSIFLGLAGNLSPLKYTQSRNMKFKDIRESTWFPSSKGAH